MQRNGTCDAANWPNFRLLNFKKVGKQLLNFKKGGKLDKRLFSKSFKNCLHFVNVFLHLKYNSLWRIYFCKTDFELR
jgi:hypothetical protein